MFITVLFRLTDFIQCLFRYLGDLLRSEEHTSELQSRPHLVCRLLLEKKKKVSTNHRPHVTGSNTVLLARHDLVGRDIHKSLDGIWPKDSCRQQDVRTRCLQTLSVQRL